MHEKVSSAQPGAGSVDINQVTVEGPYEQLNIDKAYEEIKLKDYEQLKVYEQRKV